MLPSSMAFCSWNSLPTSLSGSSSFIRPRAWSLTCTGSPYSRSSKHTWQTFFCLATSWQMTVFLYLQVNTRIACRLGVRLALGVQ